MTVHGSRARRIFINPFVLVSLGLSQGFFSSQAQTIPPVNLPQSNQQDRDQLNQNIQDYRPPGTIPNFSDILKNIHARYSVSFMGPRFEGASNETYNIYLPDVGPIQLYHTAQIGYQVNENLQIGVNQPIVQNIANDVVGLTGITYYRTFEWYDPNIYFNLPNLIRIPGWFVSTSASFSLPITESSKNSALITQIIVQQSWSVNTYPSKWNYGFHLYFNPQFYNDPLPEGFLDRQTLSFSFGHNLGYQISPLFGISTLTNFYVEHRSPTTKGFFYLGESLPDTFQIKATITPNVYPYFISIGGYIQTLVWDPSWATSIIGASFSIGF